VVLSGIKVVDLSEYGPAARASRVLADYGANVLKLRRPRGTASLAPPRSAYGAGAGVAELHVDLRREEGVDLVRRAATQADVLVESYRPGAAGRMGIGPDELRARNPRLVYCSTSGYGQTGPYSSWAGHDLNYQGMAAALAFAGGVPVVPPVTIGDGAGGGMHAVIAILAALVARSISGEGAYLDVSATDGTLYLSSLIVDQAHAGADPGTLALIDGSYACYTTYEAADGRWLAVGALEEKFWANLCAALDLDQLTDAHHDPARQGETKVALAAAFKTRTRDEWVELLGPLDTCVSAVHDPLSIVDDPHFTARRTFERVDGVVRTMPVFAGSLRRPVGDGPASFGLDDEYLEAMIQRGVLSCQGLLTECE